MSKKKTRVLREIVNLPRIQIEGISISELQKNQDFGLK